MKLPHINLADPESYARSIPHEAFARLRREAPVHWHPLSNAPGFWALTKHADVTSVSRDTQRFTSTRGITVVPMTEQSMAMSREMMIYMDPPRHTMMRALVSKAFSGPMIKRLEARIQALAAAAVDAIIERGECDIVADVATELPLQVIAEIMGAPDADRPLLLDWTRRTFNIEATEGAGDPRDAEAAMMELFEYACRMAKEKRKRPVDDVASLLLSAEIDGERLTEVQFAMFFKLLTQAGNETTRSLISSTIWLLMEHPDQQAKLRLEPSLLPSAVEEVLRFSTPVLHFARTATRDVELRGQRIREGDIVVMWYVSANRDEDVFEEPDRFNIARSPNHHVSFGAGGPHFCLGANLARTEALAVVGELLRRIEALAPKGPMERMKSCFVNQIMRMPVKVTPASTAMT